MEYLTGFVKFIMAFIGYIQELVTYIRSKNDGNGNAEPPTFPSLDFSGE